MLTIQRRMPSLRAPKKVLRTSGHQLHCHRMHYSGTLSLTSPSLTRVFICEERMNFIGIRTMPRFITSQHSTPFIITMRCRSPHSYRQLPCSAVLRNSNGICSECLICPTCHRSLGTPWSCSGSHQVYLIQKILWWCLREDGANGNTRMIRAFARSRPLDPLKRHLSQRIPPRLRLI